MAVTKYTDKDRLNAIKTLIETSETDNADVMLEYVNKKLSQLEKRKGTSSSKTAEANKPILDAIVGVLANATEPMRANAILKVIDIDVSSQKLVNLLYQLEKAGKVQITELKKGVNAFSLVEGEDVDTDEDVE